MDIHIESLNEEQENAMGSFWDFKGAYDFVDKWYLMGSPMPMAIIVASYLAFVLKIGPEIMKNRKPFKLTALLGIYNAFQVMFSLFLASVAVKITMREGIFQKQCMSNPKTIDEMTSGNYYYFLCKMTELLDTVFFVLRKKQNQVSFLHVYHHVAILSGAWLVLKYEPGVGLFLGLLNSLVHGIMYTYYGLAAFPSLRKYLWWKRYITKLQLVQFVLIILQISINQAISECKISKPTITLICLNLILFLYLFTKFYINSYLVENKKENIEKDVKRNTIQGKSVINGRSEGGRKSAINGSDVNFSIGNKPIIYNRNYENKKLN